MRVNRIVLLIFAFAFLAQGKSSPSTFSEEANVPTALPLVSINDGFQGIADDFNDDSSENIGEAPPKGPPISQEQTQSHADKADGLKDLKKGFKHGHLNLKHLYKKLAPLLITSDIQYVGSNIPVGKQVSGSMEKALPTKSSQQPKKSKNVKQNLPKKSKQERPSLDEEVRPEKVKMDRKSGSGELSHLNLKGIFKKLAPLSKTSPSERMSGKSHIQLTGTNIPVGKQVFGSMKKAPPTKSSLVNEKSGKPNPKQERPFLDEDIDLEEANMDSETGSGESYQDMFESEEPNNIVGPQLRTGKTGEPNAFGREKTEKIHAPDVNHPGGSLKSDSQLTGTNIPVNKQGFGSIEKALPTISSLLKKHWPKQNLKRERPSLDKEVDSEEVMDSESGSGVSSSKMSSNVKTRPQLGSGESEPTDGQGLLNRNFQLTGTKIPVDKEELMSMEKPPPTKSSLVHGRSPKQTPKLEQEILDGELDPNDVDLESESGVGEASHEESRHFKEPFQDTKWESGEPDKEELMSIQKPPPTKSSLFHGQSSNQTPKPKLDVLDGELDPNDVDLESERGVGEASQGESRHFEESLQDTEWESGEPGFQITGEFHKSAPLTGINIPLDEEELMSMEKPLPTKSSLVHRQIPPKQNLKPKQQSSDVDSESGSKESSQGGLRDLVESFLENEWESGESEPIDPENVKHRKQTRREQDEPEFQNDYPEEQSEKTIKVKSGNEPFEVPVSEVRWTGMSLAHERRHDGVSGRGKDKPKNGSEKSDGLSMVVTMLQAIFIVGGILLVVMMAAFFGFAWPVRKYYLHLCRQMEKDRESGQNVELTSIRVDRVPPPEHEYELPLPPPPLKKITTAYTPKSAPVTGNLVNLVRAHFGLQNNEHQHEERKAADVMADDKKRDSRNSETRRLIKEQSSQRRNSLVDSIIIAKSIIDDCAKNKKFEKKASRRRHVIKECCLGPEPDKGLNKKSVSFADELETACSVIAPDSPYRERLKHSMEKRRAIKEQTSGKRRASLSDDIEIAKSIILESPKRYTLPLNLVQEMINLGMEPKDYVSYYELDFAKPAAKYDYVSPGKVVKNV